MNTRNILPDCCEDWIIEFGDYYDAGVSFNCPECTNAWQKLENDRFLQVAEQKRFRKSLRRVGGSEFASLASEDDHNPIIERCCAKMLLKYGPATRLKEIPCPICHTLWHKAIIEHGGISVPSFRRDGLEEPFTIQNGVTRSFLVPVSSFSPPLE